MEKDVTKAIIGGTGFDTFGEDNHSVVIDTKYGSVEVDIITFDDAKIAFLPRHGKGHSVPPHLINYRANIKALENLGVKHIYATVAVGSCNENYEPGDIVVIKDFLDFTKSRPITFYDGEDGKVIHVDMSDPYCKNLRQRFCEVAKGENIEVKGEAVYVCTEGPRFETAQEIKMFKLMGGDVVGMTNVPEVVLAKELGMCYSAVGIISNWCTGMISGEITLHDIESTLAKNKEKVTEAFVKALKKDLNQNNCNCNDSFVIL